MNPYATLGLVMREDTTRASDEELSSLLALAHELKAPLGLIRQMSMAQQYYDDAQREQAFHRIELVADRSLRLVEALTRSNRLEALETETINLNRLCEEVAHEFAPILRELSSTIELHLGKKPIMAVGNREVLRSIAAGLCDNALAYASSSQPIELHATHVKGKALLSVKDYGPMFEKSHLASLKSRLGRAAQPLSQRPQSSGLGLYIAGRFAKAMEGDIGLTQHRNGGHSFYIALPRSQQLGLFGV